MIFNNAIIDIFELILSIVSTFMFGIVWCMVPSSAISFIMMLLSAAHWYFITLDLIELMNE